MTEQLCARQGCENRAVELKPLCRDHRPPVVFAVMMGAALGSFVCFLAVSDWRITVALAAFLFAAICIAAGEFIYMRGENAERKRTP